MSSKIRISDRWQLLLLLGVSLIGFVWYSSNQMLYLLAAGYQLLELLVLLVT
jgi:hypothetical protein